MSWIQRINNIPLELTTGDNNIFTPIFNIASDSVNVNEVVFEFINKKGGLVKRGEIGVYQFNAEFHFIGDDAIDIVNNFKESSKDRRPWKLRHPYYDEITVQPSTLNFNYTNILDIILTTTLYETLADDQPEAVKDIVEDVYNSVDALTEYAVDNADETDTQTTLRFIDRFKNIAVTDEDLQNTINSGNEALNNIDEAAAFIRSTSELLRGPAKFYASVKIRVDDLVNSFIELINIFPVKSNYAENAGSLLISAICEAAITSSQDISTEQDKPDLGVDYQTRSDVLSVMNNLTDISVQYLTLLGEQQKLGYLPDYQLIRGLFALIGKTISQLSNFAQNSLQERNYILTEDMNLITLHHRLYGNLSTIEEFATYNELTMDELLIIKSGREVIYFV